jgi:type IV pilus assembly protein PilA
MEKNMLLFRGFSLMELMIVLAIVAILTAVGLPAYQTYTIRAKFAEVFSLSAPAQLAIAEFQQTTGEWPRDNQQAGLSEPETLYGHYVKSVSIQQNQVLTTFNENAGSGIANETVTLSAELGSAGQILWDCYSLNIAPYHLPANCR